MRRCLLCVALLLFIIPMNVKAACNHDWTEWDLEEESTCGYEGYYSRYCKECYEYETKTIAATGNHIYGEWFDDCEPGCYEKGRMKRYCEVCEYIDYKDIPAYNSHDWCSWYYEYETEKPTCGETGTATRYCKRCDKWQTKTVPKDKNNHNVCDWYIREYPNALTPGTEFRGCDCGAKNETREIPKLKAKVTLKKKTLKLSVGKTYTLKIKKMTIGDELMKWTSSNKKVATVDKYTGKIKAKKKGKTKIKVKMYSGCSTTCNVTVK